MAIREKTFSPKTAVESILFIASRQGGQASFHEVLKLRYFADRIHLSRYGRLASGDDYTAMKFGPVGSRTYDLLKAAKLDAVSEWTNPAFVEAVSGAFDIGPDGSTIRSRREANMALLSAAEIECIEEAIRQYGGMSFKQRTALSHDAAWQEAYDAALEAKVGTASMKLESIAKTLDNAEEVLEHLSA
ncbi:Panacea domain-containing protein [Variovorax sp. efr-133-TYG-130]|uniref:Panacea domain-containing protein n=1 Tax=Variovorax sp. efr-133-TYG-130 TaxID=3040327 RepID=UPI0025569522|nr:Panacea domain-containing protein [Variovorax sp. efr-133-TYG-130]